MPNLLDDPTRKDKVEKVKEQYKKDIKNRKSGRPMGYIFPNRIKSLLNGETPSTTISMYNPSEVIEKHNTGEMWEQNGYVYIQHEGWLEKTTQNMLAIQETEIHKIKKCSKCGNAATNSLDKKFLMLRGLCFDCNIKHETHLRAIGQYENYEKKIMISNALAFFKDARQEIEHYIGVASDVDIYFNDDGTQQKWVGNADKVKDHFKNELIDVDTEIKRLESELEKVNASMEEIPSAIN